MVPQLCFFVSIAFGFIAWGWSRSDTSGQNSASYDGPKRCGLFSSCTVSALSG